PGRSGATVWCARDYIENGLMYRPYAADHAERSTVRGSLVSKCKLAPMREAHRDPDTDPFHARTSTCVRRLSDLTRQTAPGREYCAGSCVLRGVSFWHAHRPRPIPQVSQYSPPPLA